MATELDAPALAFGAMGAAACYDRHTEEHSMKYDQIVALAKHYRFQLRTDAEGYPFIPGRAGQIEWHDGKDLAVYTDRPRLFAKLRAIPGVRSHQIGDREARMLFWPDALEAVTRVIQARRKRRQVSSASLSNLRPFVTQSTKPAQESHP